MSESRPARAAGMPELCAGKTPRGEERDRADDGHIVRLLFTDGSDIELVASGGES